MMGNCSACAGGLRWLGPEMLCGLVRGAGAPGLARLEQVSGPGDPRLTEREGGADGSDLSAALRDSLLTRKHFITHSFRRGPAGAGGNAVSHSPCPDGFKAHGPVGRAPNRRPRINHQAHVPSRQLN